jgi:sugar phosphate permease
MGTLTVKDNRAPASLAPPSSVYPWVLLGLLWMVSLFNAADRSILIAVMPQLRTAFSLDRTQLALLNSLFLGVYAVSSFVSGFLGDTLRRSRIVIFGLMFWSASTGLCSMAATFPMLLALRAVVGVGESSYYPSGTALIGDWTKPGFRSRALSLHQTAVFAGGGIGALAAGLLADHFGWRAPFMVFAVLGLAHAFILMKFLKDRPAGDGVAKPRASLTPLKVLFKTPSALMLCGVFALGAGAATGIQIWAPTYVHDSLKLSLASSAFYGLASINLAGFLSVPLGGVLADMLAKRYVTGRFLTLAIGLGVAGLTLLPLATVHTAAAIGCVLLAASFGKGLFDGCIYAAMQDVIPASARSTAVGFMTMIGFLGGAVAPFLIAKLAGPFGMAVAITSMALLYFTAALVLLLWTRRTAVDIRAAAAAVAVPA